MLTKRTLTNNIYEQRKFKMGEALGKALLYGVLVFLGMAVLSITGIIAGIIALCTSGGKRKGAIIVSGISFSLAALPLIVPKIDDLTTDLKIKAYEKAEEKKLRKDCTKLIYAVEKCNLSEVIKLLEKKADPNEIYNKRSPLTSAFLGDNTYRKNRQDSDRIIEALLNSGADPNLCIGSKIPMRYAIENDRLEALKLLVDHGAIIDTVNRSKIKEIKEQGRDLGETDPAEYNYDFPPVQFAFMKCSFECAEYLLEKNADCTIWYDSSIKRTLLMKLMNNYLPFYHLEARLSIMNYLFKYVEDDDLDLANYKDIEGKTALHYFGESDCLTEDSPMLLLKFLEYKPDINALDSKNENVLHKIVKKYYNIENIYNNLIILIENGADNSVKNENGLLPIDIFHDEHKPENYEDNKFYGKVEALLSPKKKMARLNPENKKNVMTEKVYSSPHIALKEPEDNW